ncbi:MAG: GNAT family N-acetyltransferase [Pseudomonadota bacterium]
MTPFSEVVSAADWNAVDVPKRAPMHHYIWVQACFETLYPTDAPIVFSNGTDEGGGFGAFVARGGFPKRYFLVGAEELGEPIDLVFPDYAGADALARRVVAAGKAMRFGHFPASSNFLSALKTQSKGRGVLAQAEERGSPYIDLDDSWRDPLSHFNSRRRSDFRRMVRRAEKIGEIRTQIIMPNQRQAQDYLAQAVEIEAKSWKTRTGTAIELNPEQSSFYRRYVDLASEAGILRYAFLRIGDRLAAMQIALECDDGFWLLKIGYDEDFAKCSPGNLLMRDTVSYAAEKGLKTYEFLGKSAAWTALWTDKERPNVKLRYYPFTPSGILALAQDSGQIGLKRLRAKLAAKTKGKGRA